jgi:hypothetical protein
MLGILLRIESAPEKSLLNLSQNIWGKYIMTLRRKNAHL